MRKTLLFSNSFFLILISKGGTLLKHLDSNDVVSIVYPLNVKFNRKKEAQKSPFNVYFTKNLKQILKKIRPDIIYTHWCNDFHFEHRKVSLKVIEILPSLIVFDKFKCKLFYFGTYNNIGLNNTYFIPSTFNDISKYWRNKKELVRNHKSQNPEMWIKFIEPINRLWGNMNNTDFAEGLIEQSILGTFSNDP